MKLAYRVVLVFIGVLSLHLIPFKANAQLLTDTNTFTRADSLRGSLSPYRTAYDILYYHLDVKVDIENKFISGSNLFRFKATADFNRLQFDLFSNLTVEKVIYKGAKLKFEREFNAVFVDFPKGIKKGAIDSFRVFYSGNPIIAKRAPWDGGFVFSKDSLGNPWIATANQGLGASSWWPNKDHQSDEPDSVLISVQVPNGLMDISNGRLRNTVKLENGYTRYDWFVSQPINNYSISMNIGNYTLIKDSLQGEKGLLDISYWVLKENKEKAEKHFPKNVKSMLKAFEYWFGPYPFYEDGYKLIDAPYVGMEHQSAVTYGNKYENGYLGRDASGTGWGLKWDFIIIHESGHEWFGNSITAKDLGDMWIHEAFTNYSESLYIEYLYGKEAGQEYIHGDRKGILNDKPLQGPFGVNKEGSGDMYLKGGVFLNMLRTIINDDVKWRAILRGLNAEFYHKTVDYNDIESYISKQSGIDLSKIFSQYIQHTNIPTLELKWENGKLYGRWIADVANFNMPIKIGFLDKEYNFFKLSTHFEEIDLEGVNPDNIQVDTYNYYIGLLFD
ncbi:M1 family metallopeptidase [Albibacterium bauzanense]|uniref:Peptidase M1-like protein n=1 Tax=Albibacterium bauzanense TaxID=653929 RepID=A0A4R1M1Z0_9SPHI|nr:M1 family metallopeptidase [Albibacterium bauzanense]TCK84864.1 peptidase M1-like protein [Albibacterium bauzanense]